ncbi:MAG: peptidoglycan bridge formation glycyltransferase FemA/FemB family protein, partial [Candidatus Pacebacteria bacterium]|nr:peptidoglycan bridge formation glycyltransferase FemA/FemB family protein [Candidatus Paceibacterota bacterium]
MSLKIQEIKNKDIWEDFLMQCKEKTFLQSWNWAKFQETMNHKIWRLGIYENNVLSTASFVYKIKAKRGTFLFLPHGPVVKTNNIEQKTKYLEILLKELKNIAKKEKASFIRISPIWERTEQNLKIFKELGFKNAPIHMHPELTW